MSERLGYATAVITRETYSRVPQGLQNDAGDRIDAAFRAVLSEETKGLLNSVQIAETFTRQAL